MKITFTVVLLVLLTLTSIGQNHAPVALNDTVSGNPGQSVYLNLLKNDFDPDGDSLIVISSAAIIKVNDTTWRVKIIPQYLLYGDSTTYHYLTYTIRDTHDSISTAKVVIRDLMPLWYEYLDINNINALISPEGQHFWDYENARFEVPKGSGKHALFNNSLWIGGLNESGVLCAAAEKYKQQGSDYFSGPVSTVYDSTYFLKYNRVWKINKADILAHINNWSQAGYKPPEAILNWPANGDTLLGQSASIAPFFDTNHNGYYEPLNGDYPIIRGDQSIFFVFNDLQKTHTDSYGEPLGIEIHGMAYGYDCPGDSTLNNTIFMHYDILNLSATNYHDTFLGLFTDFDLGYPKDDYMGSEVTNGILYVYNGYEIDGSGQPWAYGENPPSVGLKIIGGPYLEPDGEDNSPGGCDFGINGLNFGDRVIDNERFGLTNSMVLIEPSPSFYMDYFVAPNAYNYMQNKFPDNSHTIYGGNGHITSGGVGPDCNYMFPGNSDTVCNWGTNGVIPNGGFNQNGYYWTETAVGNVPSDRRGIASVGPFSFSAGQIVPLDYCLTYARDYTRNNNSSASLLVKRIASLAPSWNVLINSPEMYHGVSENQFRNLLLIYPNPLREKATVVFEGTSQQPYQLFSINGELLLQGTLKPGSNLLDVSTLKPGVYILKSGSRNTRIVKM